MTTSWSRRSLLALAGSSLAQDSPIFRSEVRVVNVLASVRTRQGEFVSDLGQQDFDVFDEGKLQKLRYFSRDFNLPLTVGLVIDTSMSQQRVMEAERSACYRFLDRIMRDNTDRGFLVQFDMGVLVRVGLTNSRKALQDALDYVDTPSRKELRLQSGGGTFFYDAVVKSCKEILTGVDNRKALLVLSDGDDWGSETGFKEAIEAAQRNDVVIYGIYYGSGSSVGWKAMERLSKDTGGALYAVGKKLTVEQIFARIEQELRNQYSLGFEAEPRTGYPGIRKLDVKVRRKDCTVQARSGYWSRR